MAKFCKYCGTQLEDGQVCSCPQAQAELAAPAAAPAPEAAAPVATAAPAAAPSAGKDLLNKVKETFLSYLKAPKATTAKIAADPKGMTLAGIFAGVNALAVFLYLWKILGGIMGMAGDISGGLTDKIDIEYPIFQMLIAGIVIAAVGILISTLVVLLMSKVGKQAVDFKKLLVIESVNTIFPSMVLLAGTVLGFRRVKPATHGAKVRDGAPHHLGGHRHRHIVPGLQNPGFGLHQALAHRPISGLAEIATLGVLQVSFSDEQGYFHIRNGRAQQHPPVGFL